MEQTTTVMGNRKEKQPEYEYVCLNCGQYMTKERAKDQMKRTGWDKPVCCGGSMVETEIN